MVNNERQIFDNLTKQCGSPFAACNLVSSKARKLAEENNNIITNIEVKYRNDGWSEDEFTMFVYYEDNSINQLKGDDGYGNGYYGGGFYITIKNVENKGE